MTSTLKTKSVTLTKTTKKNSMVIKKFCHQLIGLFNFDFSKTNVGSDYTAKKSRYDELHKAKLQGTISTDEDNELRALAKWLHCNGE